MLARIKNIGPGALVTAAFIGPGTVTACTLAGANFGYALLWAIVFATFSTIILQEMSARLGTVTRHGLGDVLRKSLQYSFLRWPLFALIIISLFAGNSAYEAGNLAGAAVGVEAIAGGSEWVFRSTIIGLSVFAAVILYLGSYRLIERVLMSLVLLMGGVFVATFFVVKPGLGEMLSGMAVPTIPDESLLTVIALIGTTVVPYNLFLHASAAKARWSGPKDLPAARLDTIVAVGLGGLIAILIISTAAISIFANGLSVTSAADMAVQFEPLFGVSSKYMLGIGLFAAGLSSAITAPLATGYALSELLQMKGGNQSVAFRAISLSVLAIGATLSMTGIKPIKIILLAQFANGLLLPITAGFLLYAMNHKKMLGQYANGTLTNCLGVGIVILTAVLGMRMIASASGYL